jgi:hypothetical protein
MFKIGDSISRWINNRAAIVPEGDDDSFGPQSISYDVNMPNNSSPNKKSPGKGGKQAGRTRSTSRGRPTQEETIAKILDLCKNTNEEVSKIREKLETTASELTKVKEKVEDVQGRIESVEKDSTETKTKIAELEKRQAEMEEKLEERLLAKLQSRVNVSSPPFSRLENSSLQPSGVTRSAMPLEKTMVATAKIVPEARLREESGKKIHDAFQELLRAAETRKQTFLVGVVEKINENGCQMRPQLNFRLFVNRFFDGLRFEEGKLGRAQSTGLPLGRVTVHPDDIHTAKLRIRDGWREAKDLGWWVGQESPIDLRQMETTAFRFIMETKTMCDGLRRFYLEVEDGFLRFQGAPFLPVYMVPANKELWPALAEVLLKMVQSIRSLGWLDRFRHDLRKVEPGLLDEWSCIIKFSSDERAVARPRLTAGEDARLFSKLNSLGRNPRTRPKNAPSATVLTASSDGALAKAPSPVSSTSQVFVGTGESSVAATGESSGTGAQTVGADGAVDPDENGMEIDDIREDEDYKTSEEEAAGDNNFGDVRF